MPLLLTALLTALLAVVPAPAGAADGNPYAGRTGYLDPGSAIAAAADAATDPARAKALRKVAGQPQFVWVGEWIPTDRVRTRVSLLVADAAARQRLPQLVLYAIPHRDCGAYSAGGLTAAAYPRYVREVAAGLGAGPAAVIVEPDALGLLDCLSPALRTQRLALLRDAVRVLSRTGASVYLDAGNGDWQPAAVMADRLRQAGVGDARGVSLNVAGYGITSLQQAYARKLADRLPGLHALVDTSRNGRGGRRGQWCNVSGQALGVPPQHVSDPVVDALVWVKRPGESDGSCGRREPAAGTMWVAYAVGLAGRAAW